MSFKNLIKIILLIALIEYGCNKDSNKISETKPLPINFQARNKVFEKYLFDKTNFEKLYSIKGGVDNILKSERIKVNLFDLSDSVISSSKIKSIEEVKFSFKFGKQDNDAIKKYLIKYNRLGRPVEENIFDIERDNNYNYYPANINYNFAQDSIITDITILNSDKKPLGIIKFDYDENNLLVRKEKENLYIESSPVIKNSEKGGRRKRGFLLVRPFSVFYLKEKDFNKNFKNDILETDFNFSFRYDSEGKRIEMIEWFKSGSIHKKEISTYDSTGNILESIYYDWNHKKNKVDKIKNISFLNNSIEVTDFDLDNKIKTRTIYEFDNNFNLKSVAELSSEDKVNWKIVCIFNEAGKDIERSFFIGDQLNKKIITTLNENGQIIKKEIFSNASRLDYQIDYKYNDSGFISEELIQNEKNEQVSKTVFKYNERNNIHEFIEYDNLNEPIKLTAFEYEYYN